MIRYYEQNLLDPEFEIDISYIGVMFKTLHDLNFYGRLIPNYIWSSDRIEYRIEKYIDLEEIM